MTKDNSLSIDNLAKACKKTGLELYLGASDSSFLTTPKDELNTYFVESKSQGLASYPYSLVGLFSYLSLLVKWNKVMNLVGPGTWQDILNNLIADSAYLAMFLQKRKYNSRNGEKLEAWDLGAGAGLPGVPLRLLWTHGRYTMVEARERRSLFLKTVLAECFLENTEIYHGRVEQFMPTRKPADLIVSRAFLPWEEVLDLTKPFLSNTGELVFMALNPAPSRDILGGKWLVSHEESYNIGSDKRYIWALRKNVK